MPRFLIDGNPKEIDKYVGTRIRARRTELKMSQERLAELIDVSFQQLQKYEGGVNRIGAGRLYAIAKALDAPIGFFFGETDVESNEVASASNVTECPAADPLSEISLAQVLDDEVSLEMIQTFATIDDHLLRRELVTMLEVFSEKMRRDSRKRPRGRSPTRGVR